MNTPILKADTRKSTSLLKKYLLETYGIKTSVRSEFYSMGCSLNIAYTLGVDSEVIQGVCNRLQYGAFDGMTDCSYSVKCDGLIVDGYKLEEFKHVFVKQECSNEFEVKLCQFAFSKIKFGDLLPPVDWSDYCAHKPEVFEYLQGCGSLSNLFYRYFRVWNWATQDETKINLLECHLSDNRNGEIYFIYEVDGIKYNTEEVPEIKKVTKETPAPVSVPTGKIQIIEYSEKSIAVIGETKPVKDILKELGGKFNFRLTCGPGWIFSKNKLEAIKQALINNISAPSEPETTKTLEAFTGSTVTNSAQTVSAITEPETVREVLPLTAIISRQISMF